MALQSLNPLAYDMLLLQIAGGDGSKHMHAVLQCNTCQTTRALLWEGNKRRSPRDIERAFHKQGWECDANKRAQNRCPSCIEKRKEQRRGDSGKKDRPSEVALTTMGAAISRAIGPPLPAPTGHQLGAPKVEVVSPTLTVITSPPFTPSSSPEPDNMNQPLKLATSVDMVRPLTVDERVGVRNLLDTHFDDKAGAYLNSYSDQRIGKEVNVPWAAVAKMREAAYGPLKSNPELDAIAKMIETMETKLKSLDAIVVDARKAADRAITVANTAVETVKGAEALMKSGHEQLAGIKRALDETRAKLGIG